MVGSRDREGFATAAVVCGRGMERPPVCIFGRASPQKMVALRTTRGLADVRLAAMLVCRVRDMLASVGEGRRGRNSNTIYEAGINIVCLYSFEMAPMEHVATE